LAGSTDTHITQEHNVYIQRFGRFFFLRLEQDIHFIFHVRVARALRKILFYMPAAAM
jgi:hypothetical protein